MRITDLLPGRQDMSPNLEVGSVAEIDADSLYRDGLRAVGFDVDQTLCAFGGPGVDAALQPAVDALLERFDGRACIISNCAEERRREIVDRFAPLRVIAASRKKPSTEPYREAESQFGVPPEQWAFVGDRLLTDIVGANRAGWRSILVAPFDASSDPFYIAAARRYERAVRRAYGV